MKYFSNISTVGQLASTIASGTAPLSVASTTTVTNLSSDTVDGKHATDLMWTATDGTSDLNTIIQSGTYRINTANANMPSANVTYGNLLVMRSSGADTITQIMTGYTSNEIWWRSGNPAQTGGAGSWQPWRQIWHTGNLTKLSQLTNDAGYITSVPVTSVNSKTGAVSLTYSDVGAAASGHNHTLDSLSNVTITSIAAGEMLKWTGTAWINNTLAEAGIAAASHTHSAMTGANGTTAGVLGMVPAPAATENVEFLRGDATWQPVVTSVNGSSGAVTVTIPTKVSQLTNDSGFLTSGNFVAKSGDIMTGSLDVVTPNSGTTGGLRIRANATTSIGYLQFTNNGATGEYGHLTSLSDGSLAWSGASMSIGGNAIWHGGNFTPSNYIAKTSDVATGNHEFYSTDTTGNYASAAVEIREVNEVTTAQTDNSYAPAIAFHWGGVSQGRLGMRHDGAIAWSVSGTGDGYNALWHAGNLTKVSQLSNDSGYVTSSGSVNYATSAGTASAVSGSTVSCSGKGTFDQVVLTNNGNGANLQIGDDVWLGDINVANGTRLSGCGNAACGELYFGNNNYGWIGIDNASDPGRFRVVGNGGLELRGAGYMDYYCNNAPATHFTLNTLFSGSKGAEPAWYTLDYNFGQIGGTNNGFYRVYSYGFVTVSDKDKKEDILPFNNLEGYDIFKDLKFYTYKYKGKETYATRLGIMAQDAPYIISDVSAADYQDPNETWCIDLYAYSSLIGATTQVLQNKVEEQDATIIAQQTTISDQQTKIDDLETRLAKIETLLNVQ